MSHYNCGICFAEQHPSLNQMIPDPPPGDFCSDKRILAWNRSGAFPAHLSICDECWTILFGTLDPVDRTGPMDLFFSEADKLRPDWKALVTIAVARTRHKRPCPLRQDPNFPRKYEIRKYEWGGD